LDLTIDEAALLNVAAQVWDHLGLARESTSAVAKLKAAGVDADTEGFAITEPTIAARDRSFDDIWDAVTRCRPIRFEYWRPRPRDYPQSAAVGPAVLVRQLVCDRA